jgi:hypothetical protein
MTPDRWRVVKGLFYRAIKLPAPQWPAFLDRVCAGDEALWDEIATLLAEYEPAARPLLSRSSESETTLRLDEPRCTAEPGEVPDAE